METLMEKLIKVSFLDTLSQAKIIECTIRDYLLLKIICMSLLMNRIVEMLGKVFLFMRQMYLQKTYSKTPKKELISLRNET